MMRLTASEGVRELDDSEVTAEFATGDTTTGTGSQSSLQGEEWLTRVVQYAEEQRHFETVSAVYDDLVGTGDDTLHIPKTGSHLDMSMTDTGEGAARTYTQLDNLSTVDVTISTGSGGDFYKGGIAISKEAVMTSTVDLLAQARYAVGEEMAQTVDNQLRAEGVSGANNNVDQSTSGVLTPASVADAMDNIEGNNYQPEWLVIAPGQRTDLRKDSQFTNAAEYGSDRVVQNGEIGSYLGVRVLTSTQITNDANNKAVMIGTGRGQRLVGPALVWKERPNVAMEFDQEQAEHRIFHNQAFATTTVQGDAVCTIQTA